MPRKRVKIVIDEQPMVSFDFKENTYQIDPQAKKVYRRFVEIETSKAFEIISNWRSAQATV